MSTETHSLETQKSTTKAPRTFHASTGAIEPIPRTPLKTLDHVRNELAKVYRAMKAGRLPAEDGTKRAYVLSMLEKVIEASILERRVDALERASQALLTGPNPAQGGE